MYMVLWRLNDYVLDGFLDQNIFEWKFFLKRVQLFLFNDSLSPHKK